MCKCNWAERFKPIPKSSLSFFFFVDAFADINNTSRFQPERKNMQKSQIMWSQPSCQSQNRPKMDAVTGKIKPGKPGLTKNRPTFYRLDWPSSISVLSKHFMRCVLGLLFITVHNAHSESGQLAKLASLKYHNSFFLLFFFLLSRK